MTRALTAAEAKIKQNKVSKICPGELGTFRTLRTLVIQVKQLGQNRTSR